MAHRKSLYDILGVETHASEKEIRKAFRDLTRQQHPDLFSGNERAQAEERFQAITEAFNVLRDPEKRDRYDRELSSVSSNRQATDPKEIAKKLAAVGAQQLKDGKVVEACDNLQMAIHHDDTNSRAHYFLSLALFQIPAKKKDALRHIEQAARHESSNPAILAEAARQFAEAGMQARAERFAQQALALDPTNAKAQQALATADGEDEKAADKVMGLFRRKS